MSAPPAGEGVGKRLPAVVKLQPGGPFVARWPEYAHRIVVAAPGAPLIKRVVDIEVRFELSVHLFLVMATVWIMPGRHTRARQPLLVSESLLSWVEWERSRLGVDDYAGIVLGAIDLTPRGDVVQPHPAAPLGEEG